MPPTILIVEDDDTTATLVRFVLEREGYAVTHVGDGQQALAMVGAMPPPALALLDIGLPHVDGLQLVQHIRAQAQWRNVPIVMLTADGAEGDIVAALDAGANDYVVKPFSPKPFIARLKRLLAPRA